VDRKVKVRGMMKRRNSYFRKLGFVNFKKFAKDGGTMMKIFFVLTLFIFPLFSEQLEMISTLNSGGIEKQSQSFSFTSSLGKLFTGGLEKEGVLLAGGFWKMVNTDFSPPFVLSFSPEGVGVKIDAIVKIKFDEEILYSTTPIKVIAIKNNLAQSIYSEVKGEVSFSTKTLELSFTPLNNFDYNYTYKVEISTGKVRDRAGNLFRTPFSFTFVTLLNPDVRNVIKDEEKKIGISIPAKTFDEKGFVYISTKVYTVNEEELELATDKLGPLKELGKGPLKYFDINFYNESGIRKTKELRNSVEVEIDWSDVASSVKERDKIGLYFLNEEKNIWVKIKNVTVDRELKKIKAKIYHFSVFSIMNEINYDLSDSYAYPVPWKPFDGKDETGTIQDGITFTNLSDICNIKIFTISGELVNEIKHFGKYEERWDGKNDKGKDVASGVYIYMIENEREKKIGKLMVIK